MKSRLPFLTAFLLFMPLCLLHGKKPNVILIMSDDQTVETISAFGTPNVQTPHIDKLVNSGCSFTNAYTMGGWDRYIGTATRTSIMTGRYLWHAKEAESKEFTYPLLLQTFRDANYETYGTGKWNVSGSKMSEAFDHVVDERPHSLPFHGKKKDKDYRPWLPEYGGYWEDGKHVTDITGAHAASLVKKATSQEKPFFLYVGFNAPHHPWQIDLKRRSTLRSGEIILPPNIRETHFFHPNSWGANINEDFVQQRYRDTYLMVQRLDEQVGLIMEALKSSEAAENTIIVFMSDNGYCFGENGILGQGNLSEKALKAPLIFSGPGISENKFIEERVYLADVMPTLIELANLKTPDHNQFQSLRSLLSGKKQRLPRKIYAGYAHQFRSMIVDDYKLLLYSKGKERHLELFDLFEDPFEQNDLSANSGAEKRIEELIESLEEMEKETGGKASVRNHFLPSQWK